MTSTALTHSPHVYDRAPIRVSPNSCALPDRGERVYSDDSHCGSPLAKECYFMLPPRRLDSMHSSSSSSLLFNSFGAVTPGAPSHDRYDIASPPLLGSDVSSESEDSDQCKSPPDPSTPRIPFVSVQLANATAPYPFGGGFAREPSIRDIPDDPVALPYPLHHRAKKKSISEGAGAVVEGAGTPSLKKRVKKDSVSLPAGERTRRLSGWVLNDRSECYTSRLGSPVSKEDDLACVLELDPFSFVLQIMF
ncbi:hypothetical protein H1R20_g75, partial [Candolleomyces eurysporus]